MLLQTGNLPVKMEQPGLEPRKIGSVSTWDKYELNVLTLTLPKGETSISVLKEISPKTWN